MADRTRNLATRSPGHETCNHKVYQLLCAEFEALLARANGRCEICQVPAEETAKGKLVIDHQYGTAAGLGAVRGLICVACNWMLGQIDAGKQVPEQAAVRFLANAWHVTRPAEWSNRKRDRRAGTQEARVAFRYPRAEWQQFLAAAAVSGDNASEVLRAYMDWYIREPKSRAPKRPAAVSAQPQP